eukprot:NODE_4316_length_807_cov_45.061765_g4158_i0.p1 GENE.NODE_4316_length_807_cov_45.061765_g4158_i0~~NODE_4316_length_807_cov_45.061765_g4158_i0.p1  ORF type:complete len:223 (-),score=39.87 NODE_4316_length_807_cov_45.061765_g4158_i0:139-777(-)
MSSFEKQVTGFDYIVKTVVIGDSGVGKTSLLRRYADDVFEVEYLATIGVDFRITTLEKYGKQIKLQMWDTAGQERFKTITRAYYRGANAVLLCFDVTDKNSFDNCEQWMKEIRGLCAPDVTVVLIGTKADQTDQRAVPEAMANGFAAHYKIAYFETSAKLNLSVGECFQSVVDAVVEKEDRRIEVAKRSPAIDLNQGRSVSTGRSCFSCLPV